MKNIIRIIILIASIYCTSISYAQTSVQKGIVRKITHSKSDPTIPVKGVKVVVNHVSSNASNAAGMFSLKLKTSYNKSFILQDVRIPKESNYVLAYPTLSEKLYLSKNNLIIALITPTEKEQISNENFKALFKKYHQQEKQLIIERNRLEEMQLELEESDKEYKIVSAKLDSVRGLIVKYFDDSNKKGIKEELRKIANELATTDYQSLDSINAKLYELRKAGEWEAIRNLIIKEKMNGNAEACIMRKLKDKDETKKLLVQAEEISRNAELEFEKTLKDIETIIETFKMQNLNDSVSKYYTILLKAKPNNWKYLNDAGMFEENYKSNFNLANEYFERALKSSLNDTLRAISYHNMGTLKMNMGLYEDAISLYNKSHDINNTLFAKNSTRHITTYNSLAILYSVMNDYENALIFCNKALDIVKKEHNSKPKDYSNCYNILGNIYNEQHKYKEALDMYKKVLTLENKTKDNNDLKITTIFNNIGNAYHRLGMYDKALEYYNYAVERYKIIYGENHPSLATSYDNIGSVYSSIEQYGKAITYLEKALEIRENIYGKNHPDVAYSYNNLGYLYEQLYKNKEAIAYLEEALKIKLMYYGENHSSTATTYNNLGDIYSNMKDYNNALKYYHKALDIKIRIFDKNNIALAPPYNNIGSVYYYNKNYKEAIYYFKKALDITIENTGENHINVATFLENIASLYAKLKEYDKALDYFNKAKDIEVKLYGEKNNLIALNNIAKSNVYVEKNDFENAEKCIVDAVEIFKQTYDGNYKNIIEGYYCLAEFYLNRKEYIKTIDCLKSILNCTLKDKEIDKFQIGRSYKNIGDMYHNYLKDDILSLKYYEPGYEIYLKVLGKDDEKTINLKKTIDEIKANKVN